MNRGIHNEAVPHKDNTAMAGELLPVQTSDILRFDSDSKSFSYAKVLRALGQDLEAHNLSSLDLEIDAGLYVVRGKVRASRATELTFTRLLCQFISKVSVLSGQPKSTCKIELRYSLKDIQQLELQGRAKRKEPPHMPDPYSLSQILRGAGSYLDKRTEAYLAGITVEDQRIMLRYKTRDGQLEQAQQDVEYFYNYWVKMYLRRGNRPKMPPPNDPSLIVEWDTINKRLSLAPTRFSNFF